MSAQGMGNINSSLLQQTKQLAENQEARVQHRTEAQLTEGLRGTHTNISTMFLKAYFLCILRPNALTRSYQAVIK